MSLEKIKSLCLSIGLPEGRITDEHLFTLLNVDMFFYKGNIGANDIRMGYVDGPNDGGIDYIYSNQEVMYIIQGKSSDKIDYESIINAFNKAFDTSVDFENDNFDQYSKDLKTSYINVFDDLTDDKNIEYVLFTGADVNIEIKKKVGNYFSEGKYNGAQFKIYDKNDIDDKKASSDQASNLVPSDSLDLNETKNCLRYGEDGIIVNIKASSLKKLFNKYKENGLFSYNLREHIRQKNVDDAISNTIKNERDKFWFYNNGITIGCTDFNIDGNKINLSGFSIINGAQTTTIIGRSEYVNANEDFSLVCKVVKAKGLFENDPEFISKISEASNSQKPIRPRDLKSNSREQRILQSKAAENKYPLSIEIKRGVKANNFKRVEKWQRVTNELIGQLILACILQKPGTARTNKQTIFTSEKTYNQIFKREHDYNTLYDLVRLYNIYTEYANKRASDSDNNDIDEIAIINNGRFFVLSTLIYLYKKASGLLTDRTSFALHKDNVSGLLITDYPGDDIDDKAYELFGFIVKKIRDTYKARKDELKLSSYSNFFKRENYYFVLLDELDVLDKWDREKVDEFMRIFTEKKVL